MRTRPDRLTTLDPGDGTRVKVDGHGYLTDPDDWSPAFAEFAAKGEGLVLGEAHWRVIRFMRAWHEDHGIAADARHVMAFLGEEVGKAEGRRALFALFPYGYVKQACKIAGMRQPRAWSTG